METESIINKIIGVLLIASVLFIVYVFITKGLPILKNWRSNNNNQPPVLPPTQPAPPQQPQVQNVQPTITWESFSQSLIGKAVGVSTIVLLIVGGLKVWYWAGGFSPNVRSAWSGKPVEEIQQQADAPEPINKSDSLSLVKYQEKQETERLRLELKHEREMEALRIREGQMKLQQDQNQNSGNGTPQSQTEPVRKINLPPKDSYFSKHVYGEQ